MKRLIIVRHAKAETLYPGGTDFDRSLCERGQSDAVRMANQLYDTEIQPDIVICSSAKRAVETATIFAEQYGSQPPLIKKEFLYGDYNLSDIRQMLEEEVPTANTVLLVGHNPNLSYLLAKLTGDFHQHLPTAAVAILEIPIDRWNDLHSSTGEIKLFFSPKEV